ncbi:hypothetical protein VTK26DRAFT_2304 [Humicola hyalothermophila]
MSQQKQDCRFRRKCSGNTGSARRAWSRGSCPLSETTRGNNCTSYPREFGGRLVKIIQLRNERTPGHRSGKSRSASTSAVSDLASLGSDITGVVGKGEQAVDCRGSRSALPRSNKSKCQNGGGGGGGSGGVGDDVLVPNFSCSMCNALRVTGRKTKSMTKPDLSCPTPPTHSEEQVGQE